MLARYRAGILARTARRTPACTHHGGAIKQAQDARASPTLAEALDAVSSPPSEVGDRAIAGRVVTHSGKPTAHALVRAQRLAEDPAAESDLLVARNLQKRRKDAVKGYGAFAGGPAAKSLDERARRFRDDPYRGFKRDG